MVRKHLHAIVAGCGILFAASYPVAANQHLSEALPDAPVAGPVDAELIALLEREGFRQLSSYLQDKGVLRMVDVKVSIDTGDQLMVVDFGPGFLPGPDEGYAEGFLYSLAPTLRHYARKAGVPVHNVRFLFQGKPIQHYFPQDQAVPLRSRAEPDNQAALVSSSHGLIRVFPSQAWEFQRPVAFGYREDTITPAYGDALQSLLQIRSGLTVHRARSRSVDAHPDSTRPWEHMSSRYHLRALLPDRPDIWNSLPASTANDREVSEDIRTRPLYANHLGVGALISLHTNGIPSADVRGAEVFYHENKPEDRPLAESILCGMREVIRAQPGYETFPVQNRARDGRHGENRIGNMPSILVEIAYHSNAEDSAALQDPVFREASMKGVEKGYRLFREGKDCTPLALRKIDRVTVPASGTAETDVHFEGNPQFPVTLSFTPVYCTEPGACRAETKTVTEASASPIKARMTCEGSGYGMVNWSTVMRDADGVTSGPVEHWMTCQGGS